MRQPVSPRIAIRFGLLTGTGNECDPMETLCTNCDNGNSHVRVSNIDALESEALLDVGRRATVPAATRSVMRVTDPSIAINGHSEASVFARAIARSPVPTTTQAAVMLRSAVGSIAAQAQRVPSTASNPNRFTLLKGGEVLIQIVNVTTPVCGVHEARVKTVAREFVGVIDGERQSIEAVRKV